MTNTTLVRLSMYGYKVSGFLYSACVLKLKQLFAFFFGRERIDTTGYKRHEWMDVRESVYMGCIVLAGIVEEDIALGGARVWKRC
jgi:hypothetical protein